MELKKTFLRRTELREVALGKFEVFDVMEWDSGRVQEIKRFEGSQKEAEEYFEKLAQYWEKVNQEEKQVE